VIEDATRWSVIADLNAQVLARLANDDAVSPDATDADRRLVISRWTFPLHSLDLAKLEVKVEDLQELRGQRLSAYP
jgi:hypothetical protein